MGDFLRAIPSAATNPLAFVAYLCLLLAWVLIALRNKRINSLLKSIEKLPEKDRKPTLAAEMGAVIPRSISAEQWLLARKQQFLFLGYISSIIAIVVVIAIVVAQQGFGRSEPNPEPSTAIAIQPNINASTPTESNVTAESASVTTTAELATPITETTMPTQTPAVTPTPIDVSTPEGATRAFLDAFQRGDSALVAASFSAYSLDFYGTSTEEMSKLLDFVKDGFVFSYHIDSEEIQQITDETVRVPVSFDDKIPYEDCCILRKENNVWRVNLNHQRDNGDTATLVDYQSVDMEYTQNDVVIRLVQIIRYSDRLDVKYGIENKNPKRYVLWGIWDDADQAFAVYFGDQPENIRARMKVAPITKETWSAWVGNFQTSYPTAIDFRGLRLSRENDTNGYDPSIEPWSYRFVLQNAP